MQQASFELATNYSLTTTTGCRRQDYVSTERLRYDMFIA
jgi:hypothetical protein